MIYDVVQGSDEWHALRLGKFTASQATAIANQGQGLKTLCMEKATEILTGKPAKTLYKNEAMIHGNEAEEDLRIKYFFEYEVSSTPVGFAQMNDYVGCSPDGMTEEIGRLQEMKNPTDRVYAEYLYTNKIDTGYMWQMQMQMLVMTEVMQKDFTDTDYIVGNGNFKEFITVQNVKKDKEAQDKLRKGLIIGTDLVKEIVEEIRKRPRWKN